MSESRRGHGRQVVFILVVVVAGATLPATAGAQENRPELLLPLGHGLPVTSVALSGDGTCALTGAGDRTALLWDTATGRPMQIFKGHTLPVASVALSGDGKRVLTGSWDKTAILWDASTGKPLQTFTGHTDQVKSVALSADAKRVLTGSRDMTAILWDATTGKALQTLKGQNYKGYAAAFNSVALSGDGKRILTGPSSSEDDPEDLLRTLNYLAAPREKKSATLETHTMATLWDADTGTRLGKFTRHAGNIRSVALSGDGKLAVTGSNDRTAILWDVGGKVIQSFTGHTLPVTSVALSRDGKRVLTGSDDRSAILWDARTGKPLQTFKGHTDAVISVALSHNGQRALTCYLNLGIAANLWDARSGQQIQTLKGHTPLVVTTLLSGDGKRLLSGSLSLTGSTIETLTAILAGGAQKYTATLWDMESAKHIQTMKIPFRKGTKDPIALSGDGSRILTIQGKTAILWNAHTGKPVQTFAGHQDSVSCVALSKDGQRAFTGSLDKVVIQWDAHTGKQLRTFTGHTSPIATVALSADGKRLLVECQDTSVILWEIATARSILSHKGITCATMSADGQLYLAVDRGRIATLWEVATVKPLQTFEMGTGKLTCLALSEDGKRVLTGSLFDDPMLWDAGTGKPLQTFKERHGGIFSVAIAPQAAYFVTSSLDGTVRIWKAGRGEPLFSFLSAGDEWLFWTPEGYYTCSPNGENLIAWKIPDDSPQGYHIVGPEQFRKKFHRPDMFRHLLRELDVSRALAAADRESGRPVEPATTIARALPPIADIIQPARDGEVDADAITVETTAYSVGEYPVTRMRLLVDGRPYQGNLSTWDIPQPKLGKARRSWQVELEPGEHTVQAIADNAFGIEGRSSVVRITRKSLAATRPRLFVLAIGISNYEKEKLRKGVYYSAADANRFADTVAQSSKPLYREINVVRLIDRDATRKKILQALGQIRKTATQNDVVLLFFAGHGMRDTQKNFYFLTVDVDPDEPATDGLSEAEFKTAVKALPGKVVLLLDACHSGSVIFNERRSVDGLTERLWRDLTSNEYGLVVMCSSKWDQESLESNELKAGYFTAALVEGLQGQGKIRKSSEGAIYFRALDQYVTERVRELTSGRQQPLTSHSPTITDIVLTRP